MINQLDQIIKKILDYSKAPAELRNAEVSFAIPEGEYSPANDTVNLYLYDVHENRELRDPAPIYEIVDGNYKKRQPPLRVDCSYMLTAWSKKTGEASSASEHQMLGQALAWLGQYSKIPTEFLPDEWKDKNNAMYQTFPAWISVAQMNGVKEPGEFWAALGSSPRPFLNLVITIAMRVGDELEVGPPVSTRVIQTGLRKENKTELKPGTKEEITITEEE